MNDTKTNDYKYYAKQLRRLNGNLTVKFYSENGNTNTLDLNKTSCQAIARVISELADRGQIIVK